MALRRRFRYRIQAFSVELSTIIPKVTVSSLHLSPYFIEFQANQLKIHKKKITENDKILCAILFFKKKKKLLRIQHFLMKKKIPARNRGMLIFFVFQPVVRLAERVTAKPTRPQQQPVVAVAK